MENPETFPASVPLIAYAEQFLKGARVLLRAPDALPLAEALFERGARLVHVFESDPVRRAEAEARVTRPDLTFSAPDYALREGYFDLALIEDMNLDADAQGTTRGVAQLLTPRGIALFASPNPEAATPLFSEPRRSERALDYYGLYDAVAAAFPAVRMLGQVPFVGCALVDFSSEEEPSPVFDTSLLGRGEEPEYFVALGSRERKSLESYVVVQLPSSALVSRRAVEPSAGLSAPPAINPPSIPAPEYKRTVMELTQELSRQEAWIAELEARSAAADERADNADAELDELRERHANLEQASSRERASLAAALDASRSEVERLKRRLNDSSDQLELKVSEAQALAAQKAELQAELAAQKAELTALANDPLAAREMDALEHQLKEQGQRLRALERELREAERTGRELVRKLTAEREKKPASSSGLAERLVEAEAELTSLRWSLQMLGRGRPNPDTAAS